MSRNATLDAVFANLAAAQQSLTTALAVYVGSPAPTPTPAPAKEAKLPKAPKDKSTKLAARRAEYRAKFGPKWFEHPEVVAAKAERKARWEAIKAAKTPAPEPKAPKGKKSKNRAAAVAAVAKAAK